MFVAKSPSESPCARSGFLPRFLAARKISRGFVLLVLSNLRQHILVVPAGLSPGFLQHANFHRGLTRSCCHIPVQSFPYVSFGFPPVSCNMQVSTGVCTGFVVGSPSTPPVCFVWCASGFLQHAVVHGGLHGIFAVSPVTVAPLRDPARVETVISMATTGQSRGDHGKFW